MFLIYVFHLIASVRIIIIYFCNVRKKNTRKKYSGSQSPAIHYRAVKISISSTLPIIGTDNIPEVDECSANWLAEEIVMFGGGYGVLALPQETISLRP